ncbi:hypothetical protein FB451DRAFT_1122315 [Mycena latifolia]|nr:hypothetical protein FB451DRAFT_1122315 [Mycena latifolia]
MAGDKTAYMRLFNEEEGHLKTPDRRARNLLLLSAVLNLVLLAAIWIIARGEPVPGIYSPAQHAVRTKLVKFTRGFAKDVPIYERRPSPVVDEAWRSLYEFAETKISSVEAAKMPNHTWPFLGEETSYVIALDVFHQLHCLDMLRWQLHPGHNYTRLPMGHVRHCIGAIRQALMCSADVTPIVWQWSDRLQVAEQRDDVVHVCRDFSAVRDWARDHFEPFPDPSVYIEGDGAPAGKAA